MSNLLDIPITLIFTFDIIMNFNIAIEHEDGRLNFDRYEIFKRYISGWFWLDFLSTFPVGMIFDKVNDDILRGSKAIRLIRFIKLLRVVKLSKLSFVLKKNEITKVVYKILKQNQGYFDLLKNMGLI